MRTPSQILSDILADARVVAPSIAWVPKTPQADLIACVVGEASRQMTIADYVRGITTLVGIQSLSKDAAFQQALASVFGVQQADVIRLLEYDLDNLAEREGFSGDYGGRKAAASAMTVARFSFANSAAPVTIPVGSRFRTISSSVYFDSLDPIANVMPTIDSRGVPVIYGMVQAEVAGASGNVVAGTQMVSLSAIAGLTSVSILFNTSNGRDKETNLEYIDRIRTLRLSRGAGTKSFYASLILQDSRVYDVVLYGVGDGPTHFKRAFGLDIWIHAAETPSAVTEVVPVPAKHYFRVQPLINEDAIETEGFTRTDPNSTTQGSVLASSYASGTSGTITYFTDKTVRDLQLAVQNPDYWVIGGKSVVLVKKGFPAAIKVKADIYLSAGYDWSTVVAQIEADLQTYFYGGTTSAGVTFSRKKLGEVLQRSDILDVVLSVAGVDQINLSTFSLFKNGVKVTTPLVITPAFNEYATFDSLISTQVPVSSEF